MNAVVRAESLDSPFVQEIRGTRTTVYLPFAFDWKRPNYGLVFEHRARRLADLREYPERIEPLKKWYKHNIAQMITDWGCTFDPRTIGGGQPSLIPFILFPKQIDWIDWAVEDCWKKSEPGLTEKSRDCGVSWLAMCLSCELAKSYHGLPIGFGSATAKKIDESDNPNTLFHKGRFYLNHIPQEFRGGWVEDQHSAFMRLFFPETQSYINGEAGDEIGRGGRTAIYFVDESAHLQRPQLVESSLLSNSNCRIDMSSVKGMANPFAQKRHKGKVKFFTFHWRDDPRKDDAWYEKQKKEADELSLAQDIDINYLASVGGQIIPSEYVAAAIGAYEKLGIQPTGMKYAGFDPADEGEALNALAVRHGCVLNRLDQWTGKGTNLFESTTNVINICDELGLDGFDYDADGIGSGCRGDAEQINMARKREGLRWIFDAPFRGSGAVDDPEGEMVKEKKNKDFFRNLKAQSWWALRLRFEAAYRAVVKGMEVDPETMISISPDLPNLGQLQMELAQPTYKRNETGKVVVNKQPEGTASPNLADAIMIAFNPTAGAMDIWRKLAK